MLENGMLLDGKYRILYQIARGGMSNVYLAINEKAKRKWVVKEVRREGTNHQRIFYESLLMEVGLLRELSHPHLPGIVDVVELADRILIVMDYIEGETLELMLVKRGNLDQSLVIDLGLQLCETLGYLHSQKPPIIYRDMKPSNIILKKDGQVVLIDFGTARKYNYQKSKDTIALGTRGYAAPEQFLENGISRTDERTDIYNLGVTLYHVITGHNPCHPPYEIKPIRFFNKHLSTGLEAILLKCTKENPDERFLNVAELADALRNYQCLDQLETMKDKRRLRLCLALSVFWLGSAILMLAGRHGINIENGKIYYQMLARAESEAIVLSYDDDRIADIAQLYQKAIEFSPRRVDGYLQLLDFYLQLGDGYTAVAVRTLSTLINLYQTKLQDKDELYKSMAFLCFNGNKRDAAFEPDYNKAFYFYSQLDERHYPEAKIYISIAKALSALQVDWEEIAKTLNNLEQFITDKDAARRIEHYILFAGLISSNVKVLSDYLDNPLQKAIYLLEQAEAELNSPYYQETDQKQYIIEVYSGLADGYYRSGNLETATKRIIYMEAAFKYYQLLADMVGETGRLGCLNKMAEIYNGIGRYKSASSLYEEIIELYPQDAKAYAHYGMMVLLNDGDFELAKALYQNGMTNSPTNQHHYFISLQRRLEQEEV